MMNADFTPLPVGTRVVLIANHRADTDYGRRGWRGVTTAPFSEESEAVHIDGGYTIKFDGTGDVWCVNASAVAPDIDYPHQNSVSNDEAYVRMMERWMALKALCNGPWDGMVADNVGQLVREQMAELEHRYSLSL